jgi:hypothetical protein
MQEGAGPRFQNPPSVPDVRGAAGASLRVWSRRPAISGRRTHTPGGAESYDDLGLTAATAMLKTTLIEEGCVG